MKVLFSIILLFASLSFGTAQSDWLLDSISIFQIRENSPQSPYFAKVSYNAEGQRTFLRSTLSETTYTYGTHDEGIVALRENDFTYKQFRRWDNQNRTLYSSLELLSADSFFNSFSENIHLYDGRQVKDYDSAKENVSRQFYIYEENKLSRTERYSTNSELLSYTDYSYDEVGRLLESLEVQVNEDGYQRYTYSFDDSGRLLEQVYTFKSGDYVENHTTTYLGGNGVDSIVRIFDAGYFIRGVLQVNEFDGNERISTLFQLQDSTLNNPIPDRREIYRFISFPHGFERVGERYVFNADHELELVREETTEIIDEQDSKYTTRLVVKNFDSDGATTFIKTEFCDYILKGESSSLDNDIDFLITPNPMSVGSYFKIELNQTAVSRGFIYDQDGRQVQSLSLGSRENMHWRAPDMPGQYFIVFIGEDGSRSIPKMFQVY